MNKDNIPLTAFLRKSIQLRRYHVAILTIAICACVLAMWRYFEAIGSQAEEFMFTRSMAELKRGLEAQYHLSPKVDPDCSFLDSTDFLTTGFVALPLHAKQAHYPFPVIWEYQPQQHRLIYHVNAKHFIESSIGPRIEIDLLCQNGQAVMQVSPHRWCQTPGTLSCLSYTK